MLSATPFRRCVPSVVALLVSVVLAAACASRGQYIWIHQYAVDPTDSAQATVRAGDQLSVIVRQQAGMSGTFTVQADGRYTQPLVGHIAVAGRSPKEVERDIAVMLKGIVLNPVVSVSIGVPKPSFVTVVGEVGSPGKYEIVNGDGVLEVLVLARGLSEFAHHGRVFVLRAQPKRLRVRFDYDNLVQGDPASRAFLVRDGDVVVVE
ncbi:MAG: polysaccharide biosynthesis/export family protein [Nannocystaceae bacterium]